MQLGRIAQCWSYPVKSMQGRSVDRLHVGPHGVAGDRAHALVDLDTDRVLSAKSVPELLEAFAAEDHVLLPDGTAVRLDDEDRDAVLSAWLGRRVTVLSLQQSGGRSYEMTFDPPDDDAEYVEIPLPEHGFVDLAPLHVVASATLDACGRARPDLDWDVRRFRSNLVIDHEGGPFAEDAWIGSELRIGEDCVLSVDQPTVRSAMPLRAQPALDGRPALGRQRELFAAMNDLHEAFPNHLGVYLGVVRAGAVAVGDTVVLQPPSRGGAPVDRR